MEDWNIPYRLENQGSARPHSVKHIDDEITDQINLFAISQRKYEKKKERKDLLWFERKAQVELILLEPVH